MTTFPAGTVSLILVLSSAASGFAAEYDVGGSAGWGINVDYKNWVSGKTFSVGDTLVFSYASGHTVKEVSENDYNTCTADNPMTTDSSGTTKVALKTVGTHFFICGTAVHCSGGMKLAVTAKSGSSGSPSSEDGTKATPPPSKITASPSSGTPLSRLTAIFITWVAFFLLLLL